MATKTYTTSGKRIVLGKDIALLTQVSYCSTSFMKIRELTNLLGADGKTSTYLEPNHSYTYPSIVYPA